MRRHMMDVVIKESNPNRVDVNKADTRGMTPLHAAGIRSGKEIMDILCGVKGIDLNPKDCYGRTPLMIACMTNNEDAVRTLLSQPTIDLFTKDDQGRSLDHYAKRNVNIHQMLVETRRNPTEVQELARVKNILNKQIAEKENREGEEGEEEEKIKTILENHAAEDHINDVHTFHLDENGNRNRRREKMKKERNVEKEFSSENVENYQGHLDIETILSNIENKKLKKKGLLKKVGCEAAGVKKNLSECANPGCEKRGQHRCSRCLTVAFCSRECSVIFWPQHQKFCEPARVRKNSLSEVD